MGIIRCAVALVAVLGSVNTTDGSPSVAPAAGLPPAQIAGIGLIIKGD